MKRILISMAVMLAVASSGAQSLSRLWEEPPKEARPWVYWYWMHGAFSYEAVTADLQAMKDNGIGGAMLFTIRGIPETGPMIEPSYPQLSPEWWDIIKFAITEAERIGIELAFHSCDGWALAGGPWITPEMSMQRVTWSETYVDGGRTVALKLTQPPTLEEYYRDIAVYACPALPGEGLSTDIIKPRITTSIEDAEAGFLADRGSDKIFRSEEHCWIQYEFDEPFLCRNIQIGQHHNHLQGQRLIVEASDDGINFRRITRLEPPRQGWQRNAIPLTFAIPGTEARFFRFTYDSSGTEPGTEDLDFAKWKPVLSIRGIYLSSDARIHQFEGKSGAEWRISPHTTPQQLPDYLGVNSGDIIDITEYMDAEGNLRWDAPAGKWNILRMGHTSNGQKNGPAGAASGLECDKFTPEIVKLQFDSWFGMAVEKVGREVASKAISMFHIDSWECSSQNWSPAFAREFRARRGYDLLPYLPVMAGIPVGGADMAERVLYDIRTTIAELLTDVFYGTMQAEAHKMGVGFSAENTAPIMSGDGMMHFKNTDVPMGEFWLQSPTHDKPNDMLDAISAAHIYGKNIVQAEGFTQYRIMWNEHPAMLKSMQDREYALGLNRLVYHVYTHNPWLDRKPGMTLGGIGLYFQRDQTWWEMGREWVDYAIRCQSLLQYGKPVVDLAVFTGEELPRRSVLPERLLPFIPGIYGAERVAREQKRVANEGVPVSEGPPSIVRNDNITNAADWVNALRGYTYDSFNPDALLNFASAADGRITLPDGMSYGALLVMGRNPMLPDPGYMSTAVAEKIQAVAAASVPILMEEVPHQTLGMAGLGKKTGWNTEFTNKLTKLPFTAETFDGLGIPRDFIALEKGGKYADEIAYYHRADQRADIYFVANHTDRPRELELSFRVAGRAPEIWYPASGHIRSETEWKAANGRTDMPLGLAPYESVFVVFEKPTSKTRGEGTNNPVAEQILTISAPWTVTFDRKSRGPGEPVEFASLTDWSASDDERIRYYSGTASYSTGFTLKKAAKKGERLLLEMDGVANLAEVTVNGVNCGIVWTLPYCVDITEAVRKGENSLRIDVVNTWANRMTGDRLAGEPDKTWNNGHFLREGMPLEKSGLTGNVRIVKSR